MALRAAFRAEGLIKRHASSTLRAGTETVKGVTHSRAARSEHEGWGSPLPLLRAGRWRHRGPRAPRRPPPGLRFPRSASFGARRLGPAVPAGNGTRPAPEPPARLARSRPKAMPAPSQERQRSAAARPAGSEPRWPLGSGSRATAPGLPKPPPPTHPARPSNRAAGSPSQPVQPTLPRPPTGTRTARQSICRNSRSACWPWRLARPAAAAATPAD